jgi:xylulokinase
VSKTKNGFIGIDLATADARATLLYDDTNSTFVRGVKLPGVMRNLPLHSEQDPKSWVPAVAEAVSGVAAYAAEHDIDVAGVCVTATSGTVVAIDEDGEFLSPAIMYDDARANDPVSRLGLSLAIHSPNGKKRHLRHASDVVNSWLIGDLWVPSDWSHALKTGYQLSGNQWSATAEEISVAQSVDLPSISAPGSEIGVICDDVAPATGLKPGVPVFLGMTDGCTSHIAAGSMAMGSATTTIGTTLVTKVVCDQSVSGPGFYSHLLPEATWLCGGASNLGATAFKAHLNGNSASGNSLSELDNQALAHGPANFITYPATTTSERFPFQNKQVEKFSTGKGVTQIEDYRAVLEGMAFAEKLGYELMNKAGAPSQGAIYTGGGAAKSPAWCQIRADVLGRPIIARPGSNSGTGAALIAWAATQGPDIAQWLAKRHIVGQQFEPNTMHANRLGESYQSFVGELRARQWVK